SYTLRNIENVVEDMRYNKIDTIKVKYEVLYENEYIKQSFVITDIDDSLNIGIKSYNLLSKGIAISKLSREEQNTLKPEIHRDSSYINIYMIFNNTMRISYSMFN